MKLYKQLDIKGFRFLNTFKSPDFPKDPRIILVTYSDKPIARKNKSYISKITLKKILYLNPPKHELLNHLLIKQLNQPYYLVDSTKKFSQNHTVYCRIY